MGDRLHFTYGQPDGSSLRQGDIVRRTADVEEMLKDVHPHFTDAKKYPLFMVLTQTCDLVRRDEQPCKSRYISLAAVRDFDEILARAFEKFQYSELEKDLGFINEACRGKLQMFLESLFNNNVSDYFFLARQPDLGLDRDFCAVLHVSIALRAQLHYETVLGSKIAQLNESFEHKLGYLVGSSYSRVATEDWVPDHVSKSDFDEMIRSKLDHDDYLWINKEIFKKAIAELKTLPEEDRSIDSLEEITKELHKGRRVRKESVLDAVAKVISAFEISESEVSSVRRQLESDPIFNANIR